MKTELNVVQYQMELASAMAEVYAASAALTVALSKLNSVMHNPPRTVFLDPSPAAASEQMRRVVAEQIEEGRRAILKNLNGRPTPEIIEKVRRDMPGFQPAPGSPPPGPAVPGDVPVGPDEGKHKGVQEVLHANGIPFRRLSDTDYVLTDHVVTDEVMELFQTHLGSVGWTLNGQLGGPLADIRRLPDLFKPKRSPAPTPAGLNAEPQQVRVGDTTIISSYTPVPAGYGLGAITAGADRPLQMSGFDGSTGLRNPSIESKGDRIPNSGNQE